jgi:hypothetical protein
MLHHTAIDIYIQMIEVNALIKNDEVKGKRLRKNARCDCTTKRGGKKGVQSHTVWIALVSSLIAPGERGKQEVCTEASLL